MYPDRFFSFFFMRFIELQMDGACCFLRFFCILSYLSVMGNTMENERKLRILYTKSKYISQPTQTAIMNFFLETYRRCRSDGFNYCLNMIMNGTNNANFDRLLWFYMHTKTMAEQ